MRRPVLLALSGLAAETEVVAVLAAPASGVHIVRRCVDVVDLMSAAATGSAGLAVIGPDLIRIGCEGVTRLTALGVQVLGLVEACPDPPGRRADQVTSRPAAEVAPDAASRMRAIGVQSVALVSPGEWDNVLALIRGATTEQTPEAQSGEPLRANGIEADSTGRPIASSGPGPLGAQRPRGRGWRGSDNRSATHPSNDGPMVAEPGRLVAVWGPTGAPGRTTVAIALADESARQGVDTLLVDADTYGGSVAPWLGIGDQVSGLAVACRRADAGLLDAAALAAAARAISPHARVLTGIAQPDRWPEIRAAAMRHLWDVGRQLSALTVVDCGFCLEDDGADDPWSPRRAAATLTTLEQADVVVAVGSADPVGLARLSAGLAEVSRLAPQASIRVVVTRVRAGAVGKRPQAAIAQTLRDHTGLAADVPTRFVPADPSAYDRCLLHGQTLAEGAPGSPARAAMQAEATELLQNLGLLLPGAPHRGRLRLPRLQNLPWRRTRGTPVSVAT